MNSTRHLPDALRRLTAMALAVGSASSLVALVTNCASNDEQVSAEADGGATLAIPDGGADAASDAPCDAAAPGCVLPTPPCSEVDWCSVDSGVSASERLNSIWGSSRSDVWAVGSRGSVVHYDGSSWKATPIANKSTFFAVWGGGPNDVWVLSDTMTSVHTDGFKNGNVEWTPLPPTSLNPWSESPITVMFGFGPTDYRIGSSYEMDGTSGTEGNMLVRKSGDVPEDKSPFTRVGGLFGRVNGMWGSAPDDMWVLIDNRKTSSNYQGSPFEAGKIMHGQPPGPGVETKGDSLAWTSVDSQATVVLRGIWGSSASDVWAVGDHGTIRHHYANDTRWQIIESPTTENLRAVWGSSATDVWIVGDAGVILHWDGVEFHTATTQLQRGKEPNLYGIWGASANDIWVVGDHTVLHYEGAKSTPTEGP